MNESDPRLWHPWLRINRVLRVMLNTRWNAEAWSVVRVEFRRAGWCRSVSELHHRGHQPPVEDEAGDPGPDSDEENDYGVDRVGRYDRRERERREAEADV